MLIVGGRCRRKNSLAALFLPDVRKEAGGGAAAMHPFWVLESAA
jgi:hypothetical protein